MVTTPTDEVPSQVRIRTDDGNEHRYDTIQEAKAVFNEGNNTAAILAACRHARHDLRAKQRALNHPDMTEDLAEVLSTPLMNLEYRIDTDVKTD
ncbi:DUF7692 domain-containing protein [Natronoglomus mannanivorans]|uniref:DUF7692 domain-containing protein n=1 Tax=Natronoglomus mannanivorans TaxID=2979990 RepID=UPI003CCCD2D0